MSLTFSIPPIKVLHVIGAVQDYFRLPIVESNVWFIASHGSTFLRHFVAMEFCQLILSFSQSTEVPYPLLNRRNRELKASSFIGVPCSFLKCPSRWPNSLANWQRSDSCSCQFRSNDMRFHMYIRVFRKCTSQAACRQQLRHCHTATLELCGKGPHPYEKP
jgi:hypothetical protein